MGKEDKILTVECKNELKKAYENVIGIEIQTEDDCILVIEYLKKHSVIATKLRYKQHKANKKPKDTSKEGDSTEKLPDPMSTKTLKKIFLEEETNFDLNTINDLARGVGYKSFSDFKFRYRRVPSNLIHPDEFDNRKYLAGKKFSVGTDEIFATLECMEDFFRFKVVDGLNITREKGSLFYTVGFRLETNDNGESYIGLVDEFGDNEGDNKGDFFYEKGQSKSDNKL